MSFRTKLHTAIGRRVAAARMQEGLSQTRLAERIRASRAAISALETGRAGVSVERLCEIAAELDTQPGELIPDLEMIRGMLGKTEERGIEILVDDFLESHRRFE